MQKQTLLEAPLLHNKVNGVENEAGTGSVLNSCLTNQKTYRMKINGLHDPNGYLSIDTIIGKTTTNGQCNETICMFTQRFDSIYLMSGW